ncbi:MAG: prepilin-type N-terminal cleavage/methylation domain-containing protein [Verrucomicrobiae bacterium]
MRFRSSGFTFVELLVALCIGATVLVVAVMAYSAIGSSAPSRRQVNVQIGLANMVNFYPGSLGTTVAVSEAPSMGATAMANSMRERLCSDISFATAVCCLARNKGNFLRPTNISIPTNIDARTLVSPDQFRAIIDTNSAVYTNFNSTTNLINGATTATNLTIYILCSTNSSTNIDVRAIYESDWVTVTNAPAGTYASVRRYNGESMTDYYHVFYPNKTNNAFQRPVAAFFTKSSTTNGDADYRKAENRPFYFVWWPDPSWVPYPNATALTSKYPTETTSTNARGDYMNQAGTTSYFFVIPAFPSL